MSFGGRPFGKATCNWKGERSGEEDREGCAVGGRERNPYEKGKKKEKGNKRKGKRKQKPLARVHTHFFRFVALLCSGRGAWKNSKRKT